MNTTIMNANETSVNWEVDMSIARKLLWQVGFDSFCEGRSYFAMLTTDERAGWMAALKACANADTSAYLVAKGVAK